MCGYIHVHVLVCQVLSCVCVGRFSESTSDSSEGPGALHHLPPRWSLSPSLSPSLPPSFPPNYLAVNTTPILALLPIFHRRSNSSQDSASSVHPPTSGLSLSHPFRLSPSTKASLICWWGRRTRRILLPLSVSLFYSVQAPTHLHDCQVCVWGGEREREGERGGERVCMCVWESEYVYVHICV